MKPLQGNSHAKIGTNTKPYSQRAKRLAQSVLTKSPTNRASAQSVLSKSQKISIDAQCVLTIGKPRTSKTGLRAQKLEQMLNLCSVRAQKISTDAQSLVDDNPKFYTDYLLKLCNTANVQPKDQHIYTQPLYYHLKLIILKLAQLMKKKQHERRSLSMLSLTAFCISARRGMIGKCPV